MNDNFNILKTMQTVAKTTQSKLDYDKTYRGYVISQNSNGKYKIKINGHIYENVDNPNGYKIMRLNATFVWGQQKMAPYQM